jgi:hypothetical protein
MQDLSYFRQKSACSAANPSFREIRTWDLPDGQQGDSENEDGEG